MGHRKDQCIKQSGKDLVPQIRELNAIFPVNSSDIPLGILLKIDFLRPHASPEASEILISYP